jgi:hypothetical protein
MYCEFSFLVLASSLRSRCKGQMNLHLLTCATFVFDVAILENSLNQNASYTSSKFYASKEHFGKRVGAWKDKNNSNTFYYILFTQLAVAVAVAARTLPDSLHFSLPPATVELPICRSPANVVTGAVDTLHAVAAVAASTFCPRISTSLSTFLSLPAVLARGGGGAESSRVCACSSLISLVSLSNRRRHATSP